MLFASLIAWGLDRGLTDSPRSVCVEAGFRFLRQQDIRYLSTTLLTEVCPNVGTEPELQPHSGETLALCTATARQDEVRQDIRAQPYLPPGVGTRNTRRRREKPGSEFKSVVWRIHPPCNLSHRGHGPGCDKQYQLYSTTMGWTFCYLMFVLIQAITTYLRCFRYTSRHSNPQCGHERRQGAQVATDIK